MCGVEQILIKVVAVVFMINYQQMAVMMCVVQQLLKIIVLLVMLMHPMINNAQRRVWLELKFIRNSFILER